MSQVIKDVNTLRRRGKAGKRCKRVYQRKGSKCEVIRCPFTHLSEVVKAVKGSSIAVAAENCVSEAKGAYTGEVSAEMVASTALYM